VLLRLLWVTFFARLPGGLSDPLIYHASAEALADGKGYLSATLHPTAYYPPGYPFFVGGIYKVLNFLGLESHQAFVVGVVQCFLWGVTTLCVVLLARRIFNHRVGTVAGLAIALWPNLIIYSSVYLTETLFVALFSVFLLSVVTVLDGARELDGTVKLANSDGQDGTGNDGAEENQVSAGEQSPREPKGVRAGPGHVAAWVTGAITLGAATMVRPQVLVSVAALLVALLVASVRLRTVVTLGVAFAIGVSIFVVPWAIRNHGVFDEVVLISNNGGDNLCIGFFPHSPGAWRVPEYCETGEFYLDGPEAEVRRNHEARERAIEYILDEPLSLPWLSAMKVFNTFRSDSDGLSGAEAYGRDVFLSNGWRNAVRLTYTVYYFALLASAVVGLAMLIARVLGNRRQPLTMAVVFLTLAGVLVPVLFFGDVRFKVPTTPLMAICAAVAIDHLWSRLRAKPDLNDEDGALWRTEAPEASMVLHGQTGDT
jgi:4-amino-4-deoxy-L-arabinose transferase-like glycosyltransferase